MSLHQNFKKFYILICIASSSASLQDVNTFWYINFGSLSENCISFSASTNKTNLLYWLLQDTWSETWPFFADHQFHTSNNIVFVFVDFQILPVGQLLRAASVWIKKKSFILKLLFSVLHFDLIGRVDRNSFLHLD